jgi:hypothetical protein
MPHHGERRYWLAMLTLDLSLAFHDVAHVWRWIRSVGAALVDAVGRDGRSILMHCLLGDLAPRPARPPALISQAMRRYLAYMNLV